MVFQLMSTELTTMRMARVTMPAAMPFSRLMNRPMRAAMMVVTTTAMRIDERHGELHVRQAPGGVGGGAVVLMSGGVERMAVTYAATAPRPTWPKERMPVLPTKIWVETTMIAVDDHDDGDVLGGRAPEWRRARRRRRTGRSRPARQGAAGAARREAEGP